MKIIEKIKLAEKEGRVVFSIEYHPPRVPDDDLNTLFQKMDRMVQHNPCFCDITWGASGSSSDLTLQIANTMQNTVHMETMMHLTCTNMSVTMIDDALNTIKSNGIHNVFALRGDPPKGQDEFVPVQDGFASGLDLVKHIRAKYGDYFGICVAGYPEAHHEVIRSDGVPTLEAYQNDLAYLKRKVDAGADFIITQLFHDTNIFLKFVNDCRQIGISCPIVPGILPISDYGQFWRINKYCKTRVPSNIRETLELIKHDEQAVRKYGIDLGTEMCKVILAHGINTLHLYTLNKDASALAILQNLGVIGVDKISRAISCKQQSVDSVIEDIEGVSERRRHIGKTDEGGEIVNEATLERRKNLQ
ncbi:hypothetical protein ACHQM5_023103 [Ranunculus cassubicifolius]